MMTMTMFIFITFQKSYLNSRDFVTILILHNAVNGLGESLALV